MAGAIELASCIAAKSPLALVGTKKMLLHSRYTLYSLKVPIHLDLSTLIYRCQLWHLPSPLNPSYLAPLLQGHCICASSIGTHSCL